MSDSQPKPQPQPEVKLRFTSFRDMPVWKEAMAVAERIFALTDGMTEDG